MTCTVNYLAHPGDRVRQKVVHAESAAVARRVFKIANPNAIVVGVEEDE